MRTAIAGWPVTHKGQRPREKRRQAWGQAPHWREAAYNGGQAIGTLPTCTLAAVLGTRAHTTHNCQCSIRENGVIRGAAGAPTAGWSGRAQPTPPRQRRGARGRAWARTAQTCCCRRRHFFEARFCWAGVSAASAAGSGGGSAPRPPTARQAGPACPQRSAPRHSPQYSCCGNCPSHTRAVMVVPGCLLCCTRYLLRGVLRHHQLAGPTAAAATRAAAQRALRREEGWAQGAGL